MRFGGFPGWVLLTVALAACMPTKPPDLPPVHIHHFGEPDIPRQILSALPASLTMPPELVEAMSWLEDRGAIGDNGNDYELTLFPHVLEYEHRPASPTFVPIGPFEAPLEARAASGKWAGAQPRLYRFAYMSGGSVGLWRGDDGRPYFVMMDFWGDKALGILTDDPVDFLYLLAMAYPGEDGYRGEARTPQEAYLAKEGGPRVRAARISAGNWVPFQPPTAFAQYLKARYGRPMPRTGAELVRLRPGREDAFTRWFETARPGND